MKMGVDFVLMKRLSKGCLVLLTVVSVWLMTCAPTNAQSFTGAVINNGLIQLGVNPEGHLIYTDVGIGLTYIPTGGEALYPGEPAEGWGVGDTISGVSGKADEAQGVENMTVESFTVTPTSAVSVVVVGGILGDLNKRQPLTPRIRGTFLVTHDYHPSISPNLFEVTVTIQNISLDTVDVRYRRVMDWDVPPTEYDEFVTIGGLPATAVISSDDNGFSDADPLVEPDPPILPGTLNVNFMHAGPADQGARFDLDLGTLAPGGAVKFIKASAPGKAVLIDDLLPGESVQFNLYYGAAGSENEAMAALVQIGAEVYSLGEPSNTFPSGEPNTFIFALTGVGGTPITSSGGGVVCIQDDRTNDHIQFNVDTGEYGITRCSDGSTLTGIGIARQAGCVKVLRDVSNGRNLFAICQNNPCGTRGQFRAIDRASRMMIKGFDNDVTNNSCSCGGDQILAPD
jgi:hypothetical protein